MGVHQAVIYRLASEDLGPVVLPDWPLLRFHRNGKRNIKSRARPLFDCVQRRADVASGNA